jgi:hypothetical protein
MNSDSSEPRRATQSASLFVRAAVLAATIICGATVTPAFAADLALQPRPGQLFAEDHRPRPVARKAIEPDLFPDWIANSPKVPGYYGRPGDFHYRNYYDTSPVTIYSRLPYACGFVGLC